MSFEKIYVEKTMGKVLVIKSDCYNGNCPIVRPDFNMVWWPVLWKRGRQYRIFSAKLLDKIYQLRKKSKSIAMLWEQGIPISNKIVKSLIEA